MSETFEALETLPVEAFEAEPQESIFDGIVQIDLPAFKGPLDVLCYLLRRGDIDTRAIPPAAVAEQVYQTIPMLAGRDIIGAGTSIYYDALLLDVKSALLGKIGLPEVQMAVDEKIAASGDTQAHEYFAGLLRERWNEWSHKFCKGEASAERQKPLKPYDARQRRVLYATYLELLNRPRDAVHVLAPQDEPISRIRDFLIHRLPLHVAVPLDELFSGSSLVEMVIIFLSLLDMSSQQVVSLFQNDGEDEVVVTRLKTPLSFPLDLPDEPGLALEYS